MPDLLTISALVTTLKNATDLAKGLKNIDTTLEKAELKLRIANLIESLADAKIQATEIQDLVREKDKRIKELEDLLNKKTIQISELSEECLIILEKLSGFTSLYQQEIEELFDVNNQKVRYYLERLLKEKLIKETKRSGLVRFEISPKGREVLFNKTD